MESVLLAALLAAAQTEMPPAAPASTGALDRRCFALMAALAEDEDPRVGSLGRVAAHYFLGRIDAEGPGFDPAAAGAVPAEGAARAELIAACGDAMQAGGHDFRAIGRALEPRAQRL